MGFWFGTISSPIDYVLFFPLHFLSNPRQNLNVQEWN